MDMQKKKPSILPIKKTSILPSQNQGPSILTLSEILANLPTAELSVNHSVWIHILRS